MNNLLNQTFGKLTVKSISHSNHRIIWNCECSCGNVCEVSGSDLMRSHTTSCGCNRRKEYGYAAMIKVLTDYKRHAKIKNINFDLSEDEFIFLTKQNCHYCGCEPSQISNKIDSNGEYIYNGIDRVNQDEGYTIDNCVSCCSECNYMKNTQSQDGFLSMVKRIYEYQNLVSLDI